MVLKLVIIDFLFFSDSSFFFSIAICNFFFYPSLLPTPLLTLTLCLRSITLPHLMPTPIPPLSRPSVNRFPVFLYPPAFLSPLFLPPTLLCPLSFIFCIYTVRPFCRHSFKPPIFSPFYHHLFSLSPPFPLLNLLLALGTMRLSFVHWLCLYFCHMRHLRQI